MKTIPRNCLLMLPLALFSAGASAQTWSATAAGNWSDAFNWSSAPANDGTADILFDSAVSSPANVATVNVPFSINSLSFGNAAETWTIAGTGPLTLGVGGIVNNSAPLSGTTTISVPLVIGASQTWNPGTFADVNRQITLSGTLTGGADKTITIAGEQSGTLYRKFVVSSNNTATLASSWIIGAGGRLSVASSSSANLGTGTITVNPGGQLGGEGGSSVINNPIVLAGGTLGGLGFGSGGTLRGNINITENSYINLSVGSSGINLGAETTPATFISGTGNLTVYADNPSTLITRIGHDGGTSGSTAPNTCTGTLIINTGVVDLSKRFDNIVAWAGNIEINSGGMLRYNAFREELIANTSTVTINDGGIWNIAHGLVGNTGNQQFHETIAGLEINTQSEAFINDYSTPEPTAGTPVKGRILLGTGPIGPNTAEQGIYVNPGGLLSGTGIVNKDTVVRGGVLSPGNASAPIATLTFSENLTLAAELAEASLPFTLDSTSDRIVVSGGKTLDIGAGILDFASFQFTPGSGFAAGTYTLIDTSSAIVGSLGAPLTGTIGGLTGKLELSSDGQDVQLVVTSAPPASFSSWAAGFTGPALVETAPTDDPDGDGVSNAIEYVLGTDPRFATAGVPVVSAGSGNLVFTFERSDASETADVTVLVQVSADLSNWTTLPSYAIGATSSEGVAIIENDAANDLVTVTIPMGTDTRRFARLHVTVSP